MVLSTASCLTHGSVLSTQSVCRQQSSSQRARACTSAPCNSKFLTGTPLLTCSRASAACTRRQQRVSCLEAVVCCPVCKVQLWQSCTHVILNFCLKHPVQCGRCCESIRNLCLIVLAFIHKALISLCDHADGHKDGIVWLGSA